MTPRPLLLDLFCGAGGAAMGYSRAGFDVVGVDLSPQPRYPFRFIQGDALRALEHLRNRGVLEVRQADGTLVDVGPFAAIHASPPCHAYSTGTQHRKNQGIVYPDLLPPTQALLPLLALPYVIENVPGARKILHDPILLCGGMFDLGVTRHRYFEVNFLVEPPAHTCNGDQVDRDAVSITRHGPPARWYRKNPGAVFNIRQWHDAMGIDWMNRRPLTQAIPPAYTEFLGRQLLAHLAERAA